LVESLPVVVVICNSGINVSLGMPRRNNRISLVEDDGIHGKAHLSTDRPAGIVSASVASPVDTIVDATTVVAIRWWGGRTCCNTCGWVAVWATHDAFLCGRLGCGE